MTASAEKDEPFRIFHQSFLLRLFLHLNRPFQMWICSFFPAEFHQNCQDFKENDHRTILNQSQFSFTHFTRQRIRIHSDALNSWEDWKVYFKKLSCNKIFDLVCSSASNPTFFVCFWLWRNENLPAVGTSLHWLIDWLLFQAIFQNGKKTIKICKYIRFIWDIYWWMHLKVKPLDILIAPNLKQRSVISVKPKRQTLVKASLNLNVLKRKSPVWASLHGC